MDDSSCMGQYCGGNAIQDWGNGYPQLYGDSHSLEKSISVFDIPKTFRFNYNWDLPIGRGKQPLNRHPGLSLRQRSGRIHAAVAALGGNGHAGSG